MDGEAHIIIQIVDHPLKVEYTLGFESALKKQESNVFHLDNYSDLVSINLATKFIQSCRLIQVYMVADNSSLGKLTGFFRHLLTVKTDKNFRIVGQNELIEKMIKNQEVTRFDSLADLAASLS